MKFKSIHLLSLLLVLALALPIQARDFSLQQIKKDLPKMLGANNVGREFYFSFIPCWQTNLPNNDLMIYISSGVRTKVVAEVPGKGWQSIQYTVPNDIIAFKIDPAIGQPYTKTDVQKPQPDQIWPGAGVHVYSDDPIICYGVTRYTYTSDGFLAVPVPALGREYIAASWADPSDNQAQYLPSYVSITAAYDHTQVTFTLGGNDWTTTVSGQEPGQSTRWNLNAGDVLLFAGYHSKNDLTGSKIEASKPVAVVDGNFCAYIPTNVGCCDMIESMEFPTQTWGTEYHVTKIEGRKKNSFIHIFAKDPMTTIFRDFNQLTYIQTAGGVVSKGYVEMRAAPGAPVPVVISGDKPISVTQYNPGEGDDGVSSDPFQLILTPLEQYQKEIIFNTPGIKGGVGFAVNYINICYQATQYGTLPDDLEFAQVHGGQFQWQKVKDISPNAGTAFAQKPGQPQYFSKTLLLPGDGVYKLKADKPFAAYAYGFADYDSYGYPTSVALGDLTKVDTIPPAPAWTIDCHGDVNFTDQQYSKGPNNTVTDYPDDAANRSNLSSCYMHTDISYNYQFIITDFMPCQDRQAKWGLRIIDNSQPAFAAVTFSDCAGNDTTIEVSYSPTKLRIDPKTYDFGRLSVGQSAQHMFYVVNYSDQDTAVVTAVVLQLLNKGLPQGFNIYDATGTKQIALPDTLMPLDSLPFTVKFDATKEGAFWDSLGVGDTCNFWWKSYVQAEVGQPIIDVTDINFPKTQVGSTTWGSFDVKNIGSTLLSIYGFNGPNRNGILGGVQYKIYKSNDLVATNVSPTNPINIMPNQKVTFNVSFTPADTIEYKDTITFLSNTVRPVGTNVDSLCILDGSGLRASLKATSYNWARKRIDRPNFPVNPYPAVVNALNSDIAIKLVNEGNDSLTITSINIPQADIVGDTSAFHFDRLALLNAKVYAHDSLIVPVTFQPKVPGDYSMTIQYVTNKDSIKDVQSVLKGVGIVPRIATEDVAYGSTIINDTLHAITKTVMIRNLTSTEWQYGDSVTITGLNELNINTSEGTWAINEPFRYEKSNITFPLVLQPGDSLIFTGQFVAKNGNPAAGSITTVSDADTNVATNWTGSGLVPAAAITNAGVTTCTSMPVVLNDTISNTGVTKLYIDNIAIKAQNQADQNYFSFNNPADATPFPLDPGASQIIGIKYNPTQPGQMPATLTCIAHPFNQTPADTTDWNIPLTSQLTCAAEHYTQNIEINPKENTKLIPIDGFDYRQIKFLPGQDPMPYAKVIGFDINIRINPDFLKVGYDAGNATLAALDNADGKPDGIILGSLFDQAPYKGHFNYKINAQLDSQNIGSLQIEIYQTLTGNQTPVYLNNLSGQELLGLTIGVYLPHLDITQSPITAMVSPIEQSGVCVDVPSASGVINIDSTCVFDIRRITFTNQSFHLDQMKPDPVKGNHATIEFEIATHSCPTKIEIYNSANQLVAIPVNKVMEPGRYQVDVPVQNWASGAYYYVMKAGQYTAQQSMVIVR